MTAARPQKTGFKKVESVATSEGLPWWAWGIFPVLLAVGFWGWRSWERTSALEPVLRAWAAQEQKAGVEAVDVARAVRALTEQNGVSIPADGISVVISEGDANQTVQVRVKSKHTVLGLRVNKEFAVASHGTALVASRYEGDGVKAPEPDPLAKARLEKALKLARCPEGAVEKGAAPPNGFETWCERPAKPGQQVGPYAGWHTNGQRAEEGSYTDGKRDGKWTRYHPDGTRAAEAFYKAGVQEGRFRTWDTSGALVDDMDYRGGVPQRR